jgi:hypothetical protein
VGDNSLVGVVICHCPDTQESATILSDTEYVRLVSRTRKTKEKGKTMRRTIVAGVALAIVGWTGSSWAWDPDEVGDL